MNGYTIPFDTDEASSESSVPIGAQGSLTFIEAMRDGNASTNNSRIKTVPHEIGHQLGLRGDQPGNEFGLMNYNNLLTLVDKYVNVLRWRRSSPGL